MVTGADGFSVPGAAGFSAHCIRISQASVRVGIGSHRLELGRPAVADEPVNPRGRRALAEGRIVVGLETARRGAVRAGGQALRT